MSRPIRSEAAASAYLNPRNASPAHAVPFVNTERARRAVLAYRRERRWRAFERAAAVVAVLSTAITIPTF